MPGAEIAQYGIGFFAIAGLLYVITKFLDKRKDMELTEVIENNTKAVEKVISVLQAIQLSLTRQEAKIDELLDRARR
ncbi:hypothetical protein Cst_c04300 [Thermoclostridium stercorarium subsp. stercorarium DSM 8532]|jgi:hypothetical protein|uniref:Holin n=1 Tax=Thermoclostridium stercorarium (strain ATCC 35414 / DSM 8532 / NCIMB 11754) TaxID=1121335 RepID=L7VL28_THES1|nr:hypothetical protein [Thermoclostridium stercorarium]AGC67452.1 hypothetical protein Cst_c04300 [Thermoclostridium stercorarium subsp. stercorarium DSM 8532]AGI38512.1 hypothetical protein Clst_0411 [Thermoclostridium stercorarium subsp. stercorarium DSM 8532]